MADHDNTKKMVGFTVGENTDKFSPVQVGRMAKCYEKTRRKGLKRT